MVKVKDKINKIWT